MLEEMSSQGGASSEAKETRTPYASTNSSLSGGRPPDYGTIAGQDYLSRINSLTPRVLRSLLAGGELTRDAITRVERTVQDFLRAVLLPFVGQWHIPSYVAKEDSRAFENLGVLANRIRSENVDVSFIGAHYRSRLSVRGRRSAFASRPDIFESQLSGLLGKLLERRLTKSLGGLVKTSAFQQIWDAIYLEQYFRLFDVNATFSEWALQRSRLKPVAILANCKREGCSVTPRVLAGGIEVSAIKVSETLIQELWPQKATELLWRAVANAIIETYLEERLVFQDIERMSEQAPNAQVIQDWLRLIHRANTLAARTLEGVGLRSKLAERAIYARGLMLHRREYRNFRTALLRDFSGVDLDKNRSKITETLALERMGEFVGVLQSLRFYQDCYGDGCITMPQELRAPVKSAADSNGALLSRRDPGSECSLTLFWKSNSSFPRIVPTILGNTPSLLTHALSEAERRISPDPHARNIESQALSSLSYVLQGAIQNYGINASAIAKVLAISEGLSRCLHEGKPRSFTFLLASPQWLISDLSIEHELIGTTRPFCLPFPNDQPDVYETTLALLEGNSSFLQPEDLALFVAWPGEPLEVTHIVRLPRLAASRRKLLSQFTADRPGLLAVVTHGNGRGEAIYEGKVRGILRDGGPWKAEPNYEGFETGVFHLLMNILGQEKENSIRCVLQPAIRELSEETGSGALFVIAKKDDIRRLLEVSSKLTDVLDSLDGQRLNEISPELLYQLARDDGAVLICADTLCVWGRRHLLTSALPDLEGNWTRRGPMSWEHWYKTKKWGTRRRTALAVSYELEDRGVVIVISADGPIDVLVGGRGVAEYKE
jgi:DNA integrity scanning protein DisA with diadenylate cyclase activity